MAQKTNLNVNPYFDDFDSEKNFYKVLFNPARPVQSRELNTIQSILQNQIESFGSHIFKEGSVVIPGGVSYDSEYCAVKLNPTSFGVDLSFYIEKYVGQIIRGEVSGLSAIVKKVVFPDGNNVENITLYVKYLESDNNFTQSFFLDGEPLLSTESISYGINNTVITDGTPFASLISENSTAIGSSVSIDDGIYFVRGTFVNVSKHTLILDYYNNISSYRIGLKVSEDIITSKDDPSLFDNAKGFTNYSAPGADRFKISLELTKKLLSDTNDVDFIELLRVENGFLKKIETKTNYNLIKDYIAQRTYDESGNYSVVPFNISVSNSLNNLLGNNGTYFEGDLTSGGNIPSDDLMCINVSPGKAYVKGYDIEKTGTTTIDVQKPRDTQKVTDVLVPFRMGNLLRINNVYGAVPNKETIGFYSKRKDLSTNPQGTKIGDARVYLCKLTDSPYTGAETKWDLYLYDIQFYSELTLNNSLTTDELPESSVIVGNSSGAVGYVVTSGTSGNVALIRQSSGNFIKNETVTINGSSILSRSITNVKSYNSSDIKSVYYNGSTKFLADTVLDTYIPKGFGRQDQITIQTDGTTLPVGKAFSGISTDTIVKYSRVGFSTETYNIVSSISSDNTSLILSGISTVTNVNDGAITNSEIQTRFLIGNSTIRNQNSSYLYSVLPNTNIANIDLNGSQLTFSSQCTGLSAISNNSLTLNTQNFNLPSNFSNVKFDTFDPEKYSIHYTDGTIQSLTDDQVTFNIDYTQITFNGLENKTPYIVNGTFVKTGIQSKTKVHKKSEIVNVNLSKYESSGSNSNSSVNDGLTFNKYYGLRVQDSEICLRYPDVIRVLAVYESLDPYLPSFDQLSFSSLYGISDNAIIGENIIGNTSKSIARIVGKSSNSVEFVYLNNNKFQVDEEVTFKESNIKAPILTISVGRYKNITNSFKLDKGQKDQYYDYSKIIRNKNETEPSKQLSIVFDRYEIPETDSGDLFSVLSYNRENYGKDIPSIGFLNIRASDTLDFRPRVSYFSGSSSSPFDFSSRNLANSLKVIFTPNESSLVSYDFYLGRIDKIYLDSYGTFIIEKGISSINPKEPFKSSDLLEVASVSLPPYLYDISDVKVSLIDNRRYTMRDIGKIEDRVENLEVVTSLSLLELNTQTLQIQDSEGINRFKTGFFADSFKNDSFIDHGYSLSEIDLFKNELTPLISKNSLKNQIIPLSNTTNSEIDLSEDFKLLDDRVRKTGKVVTLNYENSDWIEQPLATRVENVNPFHVIQYVGDIRLNPFRDTWIRTVELPDRIIAHNNTLNLESTVTTERITLNNVDNTTGSGSGGLGVGQVRDTWTELSLTDTDDAINSIETFSSSSSSSSESTERSFIDSQFDTFMRSRNTEFSVSNLKSFTQYYPFLDGIGSIDFTPKLIEVTKDLELQNPGTDGSFISGENVVGFDDGVSIITFRLAKPNHKSGNFNNPSRVYEQNPYSKNEIIPSEYSESSTILNIDTFSLSEEAQGLYSGYLVRRCLLIGETSGAAAYVKDLRLIADGYGDLIGTFFVKDPNSLPTPIIRIPTGNKTFKLSSSPSNENGLSNGTDISSAETNYLSEGTIQTYQNILRQHTIDASLVTTNNIRTKTLNSVRNESISSINLPEPPAPVINNITNVTENITNVTQNVTNVTQNVTNVTENITRVIQQQVYSDPLAQTFLVGSSRGLNSFNDDVNGAFLTAVDLFFAKKDPGNAPVTVQVRTVELGVPTLTVIGEPVVLTPDQVNVSTDGTVPTKVTFPYPIFLPPALEYAIVILAPQSDQYELWVARMGEKTVNTTNLPDVESVRYTKQFAIGSLFKSQNGSIWTDDQYEDLKFKLYKAKFTSLNGIAYFQNPSLSKSNGYVRKLTNNPLKVLPRNIKVGIQTAYDSSLIDILSVGRKVGEDLNTNIFGTIVGTGCSVSSVAISDSGRNYTVGVSTVNVFPISSNGSGLKLKITANANGQLSSVEVNGNDYGTGYAIGDTVGIVTADVEGSKGQNAIITISGNNNAIDMLYLSNVQGKNFTSGRGKLHYYEDNGNKIGLGTDILSSQEYGFYNDGKYFKVDHFNHGMYGANNIVQISGVNPDTPSVQLSSDLERSDSSIQIPNADTAHFETFEGVTVTSTYPGYLVINGEIIKYNDVDTGVLSGLERGIDSTIATKHPANSTIKKYELSGVSLRRINKNHNIIDTNIDIDSYYLEIDRDGLDEGSNNFAISRVNDTTYPMLSFNSEKTSGGSNVYASENIIYDSVIPFYNIIIPGASTEVRSQMRTISATSCNGSEISFVDLGYENVALNQPNKLNKLRMVASDINSEEYLDALPRNKSQITALTLSSNNYNLSPMIFLDDTFTEYQSARLNNPISNYASDGRVNGVLDDPHAAIYVSRTIKLTQPSNSLRVILSAYRHPSSDFRVLYSLVRPESNESLPSFNLFPGYNNLTTDNNLDGYLDVIDLSKNDGLSDTPVPSSLENQFLEYQYTAADIGPFIGFTIKIVMSGTRQDKYPKIKDLRAIALA